MIAYVIIGIVAIALIALNFILRKEKKSTVPTPLIEPTDKSTNPNSKKENPAPKLEE